MTMLDEYGDGKQDGRNDDERELFLQAALFMVVVMFVLMVVIMMMFMMIMLVLVRAAITMLMCHIFAVIFEISAAKVRHIWCNWVAKATYSTRKWCRWSFPASSWSAD